ncbi:probable G-protein coupled receptor 160 [Colossoma macropomum]|uniref:probable G-protein coupled receptor 160 n=1 Tax=Colossoma macropomum TaxID=42526 RepID=UPI001863FE3E|nr:probable G-protein coupled receptor 160 [Colossoma macropomum]
MGSAPFTEEQLANSSELPRDLPMEVSIPTLLLLLWLKALLNWLVVLTQWPHMVRTFTGVLCISLALVDTLLDVVVTQVFFMEDFSICGLHLTRYHICLLIQAAGFIYGVLHWPVFLLIGADSYFTESTTEVPWPRKLTYICGTLLLWVLATLYVFSRPDSSPITEDDLLRQCKLTSRSQSSQVATVVLLALAAVLLCTSVPPEKGRRFQGQALLRCSVCAFLSTWSPFLVLLASLLCSQAEIPAYMDMNVPWLCLLHSFHITLALRSCSCLLCSQKEDKKAETVGFHRWTQCLM